MGNSKIKAGDLVYHATACCPQRYAIIGGTHFIVARLQHRGDANCFYCGWRGSNYTEAAADTPFGECPPGTPAEVAPLSWLRKVPPLEELEKYEDSNDIPAPKEPVNG